MELVAALQSNVWTLTVFIAFLSLFIGSFLNVVIARVPVMLEKTWTRECKELLKSENSHEHDDTSPKEVFNLVLPRSHCPNCNRVVKALENLPVISYILLKGRCKGCQQHISFQYPFVELLTAALSGYVVYHFGFGWQSAMALLFTWALISLAMIDANTTLLPDNITLPFLWLGILANYFGLFCDLESSMLGAVTGYLSLWSVFQIFRLITGKEGMGYGDFKLLALLGAWLGWQLILPIILISSVTGAILGIIQILMRNLGRETPLPFGPYLAAGGWISMFWGASIQKFLGL